MRLYRTTCALSSDDGLCVEMGVSGGGRVAVAVGQRPSVRLNRITRTSKEPPFRTTQTVMGLFSYPGRYSAKSIRAICRGG